MKSFIIYLAGGLLCSLMFVACISSKTADRREARAIKYSKKQRGVVDTVVARSATKVSDQKFVTVIIDDIDWLVVWLDAAVKKSKDNQLKAHAQAMSTNYQILLSAFSDYAFKAGYTIPKIDTANVVNINRKDGGEWDRHWAMTMVDKQQNLVRKLEGLKTHNETEELNELMKRALPVLKAHLELTKNLEANRTR